MAITALNEVVLSLRGLVCQLESSPSVLKNTFKRLSIVEKQGPRQHDVGRGKVGIDLNSPVKEFCRGSFLVLKPQVQAFRVQFQGSAARPW